MSVVFWGKPPEVTYNRLFWIPFTSTHWKLIKPMSSQFKVKINLQYPWFKINNSLHDAARWTLHTGLHQYSKQFSITYASLVNCQETIIITLKLWWFLFLFSVCVDLLAGRFAQLGDGVGASLTTNCRRKICFGGGRHRQKKKEKKRVIYAQRHVGDHVCESCWIPHEIQKVPAVRSND